MARTQAAPLDHPDEKQHRRALALSIQSMLRGGLNNVGTFTLTAGTSTTVLDPNVRAESLVFWVAMNATAAGIGSIWIDPSEKQFVVNHGTAAGTENFGYAVFG